MKSVLDLEIIICCGSGGVGKTTMAAAIALKAALEGKRVIVLTIDPAKRLSQSLGLDALLDEPTEINLGELRETEGAIAGGRLDAMMLDTKRTFDRLIEKYAPSPAARTSILDNRLYQHLSNMIAGSQEYMAMEKVHDLYRKGRYDLLVLDTPPTRHALDFLEAPQKMANLTGNSLLKWFLKPGLFTGRLGLSLFGKGIEKVLSVFDRLAGFGFLHELSEMIFLISDMLGGFHDRAKEVESLLRRKSVGFLLVTAPTSAAVQDALYFHEKIREYSLHFIGFIINRVHETGEPGRSELPFEALRILSANLKRKVTEHLRNFEQFARRDAETIVFLKKMGGKKVLYNSVPLLSKDVHDLEGLMEISKKLF